MVGLSGLHNRYNPPSLADRGESLAIKDPLKVSLGRSSLMTSNDTRCQIEGMFPKNDKGWW
jgi:hypothetical protein